MNTQQLCALLVVRQFEVEDYLTAILPEATMMWSRGETPEEAIANWLHEYDHQVLYPFYESIRQERAAKLLLEGK